MARSKNIELLRGGSPHFLRVCPECLLKDRVTQGAAYVHRTHQLRSLACPFHGFLLQDSCQVCKQPVCPAISPTFIGPRCRCGVSWASAIKREPAHSNWQRLASFSHAVLNAPVNELNADGLRTLALSYATEAEGKTFAASVEALLNRAYEVDRSATARAALNVACEKLSPNSLGRQMGGHLAAAVLAACGVTYKEAIIEIGREKGARIAGSTPLPSTRPNRVRTVAEAKRAAKHHATKYRRSFLKHHLPYVYWILRLKAPKWFDAWIKLGGGRHIPEPPLPTVVADRKRIINKVGNTMHQRNARARASIRDVEWLSAWSRRKRNVPDVLSPFIAELASRRKEHMARSGRPTKWTLRAAAESLRIAYDTLANRARRDCRVAQLVPESRDDFFERLTLWGIAECVRSGKPVTLRRVVALANVNWARTDQLRREIAKHRARG